MSCAAPQSDMNQPCTYWRQVSWCERLHMMMVKWVLQSMWRSHSRKNLTMARDQSTELES